MRRCALLMIAISLGLLAGCSDSTGPRIQPLKYKVEPLVPLKSTGVRGSDVEHLPAVRVTDASTGNPVPGKVFVLTLTTPLGTQETVSRITDSDGVARLEGWRLGVTLGRYTATAITDGLGPVIFSVMVPGEVVAVYDLKTINGQPIPLGAIWGREDHFVLYESGLYNRFLNTPAGGFTQAESIMGTYMRPDAGNIEFYSECWWSSFQHCFPGRARAPVRGAEMTIDETDEFGPSVHVYALNGVTGEK